MRYVLISIALLFLLALARCTSVDEALPVSPHIASTKGGNTYQCTYTNLMGHDAVLRVDGYDLPENALAACRLQIGALKIGSDCRVCREDNDTNVASEPWTCSCSANVLGYGGGIRHHRGTWPAWNSGAAAGLCEIDLKKNLDLARPIACYYDAHCSAPSHPDGVTEPGTCRESNPDPKYRKWWCEAVMLCRSIPNRGDSLVTGVGSAPSKHQAAEQTARTMATGNARTSCRQLGGQVAPLPPKFRCIESESPPPWYGEK